MAASYETVNEVIKVVKRYVTPQVFDKILSELAEVDGNRSFKETIHRLRRDLKFDM